MHPELLHFGRLSVKAYGFMLALSFLSAIFLMGRKADKTGVIKKEKVFDLGIYIMFGSIIGARLLFVLLNWHEYEKNFSSVFIPEGGGIGGLSLHGGLIGGTLAGVLFSRKNKISIPMLSDFTAPYIALGLGFTRIGCYLNGCCRGNATQCPVSVRFPDELVHRHPVQLYESASGFALFAALLWYGGRNKKPGRVFLMFLLLYSIVRFLDEFLRRGTSAKLFLFGLTQAQVASAALIILLLVVLLYPKKFTERRR